MKEIWKSFRHGYYQVSNMGRVRRLKGGQGAHIGIMHGSIQDGYICVTTSYHGRHKRRFLHVLVAHAFIGPQPAGTQVHHKDHNKRNNCWDNLQYKTPRSHVHHHMRYGGSHVFGSSEHKVNGENNHKAILTWQDVNKIRKLYKTGKYHKYSRTLAKRFGVNRYTIRDVICGRTWKAIA